MCTFVCSGESAPGRALNIQMRTAIAAVKNVRLLHSSVLFFDSSLVFFSALSPLQLLRSAFTVTNLYSSTLKSSPNHFSLSLSSLTFNDYLEWFGACDTRHFFPFSKCVRLCVSAKERKRDVNAPFFMNENGLIKIELENILYCFLLGFRRFIFPHYVPAFTLNE